MKDPFSSPCQYFKTGHVRVSCTIEYYIFLEQRFLNTLAFLEKFSNSLQLNKIAVERRKKKNNQGKRDNEVIKSKTTRMHLQCILSLRKDRVALGCPHMHMQHRYQIIDRTINSTRKLFN